MTPITSHQPDWRTIRRQNWTRWEELAQFLQWNPIPPAYISPFPLNLPRRIADKIRKNDLNDPLLKQFLPSYQETYQANGFIDPVGDCQAQKTSKLLHKYQGRALLLCSSACAMHCRYCFRQHYEYEALRKGYEEELALLAQDFSLSEIILSGGDPLSLSNTQLQELIASLSLIPHLQRLRFHTRFPIGIPERIDGAFLDILKTCRLQTVFIIHSNHPREWDDDIRYAMKQIRQLGIPILCQTVLLKGINDDAETLQALCEELINQGIMPYYLHQFDQVAGGAHFEVNPSVGHALIQELTRRLPGYAIPRYVKEIAGEPSKTQINF